MGTILLPIKPKYVNKIIERTKLYEYRKKQCKKKVDKIIIYSITPVKKVIAEVIVEDIIIDTPEKIWNITNDYSGISKEEYMKYYSNAKVAVAYKLGKVIVYNQPKTLSELGINYSPQSFVYLDN